MCPLVFQRGGQESPVQECGGVGGGWWQAQLLGKATGHWCGDTVQPPTTATQPAPAPAPAPAASTPSPATPGHAVHTAGGQEVTIGH